MRFLATIACTLATGAVLAAGDPPPSGTAQPPTVETLLANYQEARGGAQAWAAVHALGWTGHVETGDKRADPVPFLMLFQRPAATRFEVISQTQHSLRVFDGTHGWKIHPGGERGVELEDYSPQDLIAARDAGGLDGPLVDPLAKGELIALEGEEVIAGRKAWRLKVTLPTGSVQRHWLDALDYRELQYDRAVRDRAGRPVRVTVRLGDYRTVGGLTLPMLLETYGPDGRLADRLAIEKIAINPELAADTFAPPGSRPMNQPRHGGVIVDMTRSGGAPAGGTR